MDHPKNQPLCLVLDSQGVHCLTFFVDTVDEPNLEMHFRKANSFTGDNSRFGPNTCRINFTNPLWALCPKKPTAEVPKGDFKNTNGPHQPLASSVNGRICSRSFERKKCHGASEHSQLRKTSCLYTGERRITTPMWILYSWPLSLMLQWKFPKKYTILYG